MPPDAVFRKPTAVIIFGTDRPLLHWVTYALASINDPDFIWTDVRLDEQHPGPTDPMSRGAVTPERLIVRRPGELTLNDASANVAVSGVIRDDETPENLRRLMDFLRLPSPTQHVLSRPRPDNRPAVVVLSSAQRLAPLYPSFPSVASTVRTIVESNAILIMAYADDPPGGRRAFEFIVHLDGHLGDGWKKAVLRVEKGPADSALPSGFQVRLGEFPPLASVLEKALG